VVAKPNKLQAAMMAGVIFGLLSAIPFVNLVNLCCCLWVVIGGLVAARTLINRSPLPVNHGDGAAVGAIAGSIAAAINLVVGIPLAILTAPLVLRLFRDFFAGFQDPSVREQFERMMSDAQTQSIPQQLAGQLVMWLITSAISIGFAALGGVIGVALFEKRKGQPTPPPTGSGGYPTTYPPQQPGGTQPPY
jgi:hypothetical protein